MNRWRIIKGRQWETTKEPDSETNWRKSCCWEQTQTHRTGSSFCLRCDSYLENLAMKKTRALLLVLWLIRTTWRSTGKFQTWHVAQCKYRHVSWQVVRSLRPLTYSARHIVTQIGLSHVKSHSEVAQLYWELPRPRHEQDKERTTGAALMEKSQVMVKLLSKIGAPPSCLSTL